MQMKDTWMTFSWNQQAAEADYIIPPPHLFLAVYDC